MEKSPAEKKLRMIFSFSFIAVSHWINVENGNGSLFKLWSNEKHRPKWQGNEIAA